MRLFQNHFPAHLICPIKAIPSLALSLTLISTTLLYASSFFTLSFVFVKGSKLRYEIDIGFLPKKPNETFQCFLQLKWWKWALPKERQKIKRKKSMSLVRLFVGVCVQKIENKIGSENARRRIWRSWKWDVLMHEVVHAWLLHGQHGGPLVRLFSWCRVRRDGRIFGLSGERKLERRSCWD